MDVRRFTGRIDCGPCFCQTEKQTVSKVAKAVEQAALKARQKAQQKICAYCGEEITERYQHCSAQGVCGDLLSD